MTTTFPTPRSGTRAGPLAHGGSIPTASPRRLRHIPALDGLRAIAVLAVIGYHLQWPLLGGGFLGVDLFFVLSGFLITSLLLAAPTDRPLREQLAEFYLRRSRRLLPALTLLLIAISAWAAFIAIPEQIGNLRQQGLGTVFYVSNWVFMAEDATYFETFTDPLPLQHTWSLAIEEQFYLVWPVLLLILLLRRVPRAWLLIGTAAMTLASAGFMWSVASSGGLNDAYLGTFSRVHELLIGALAAMLISSSRRGRHQYTSPSLVSTTIAASSIVIAMSMIWLSADGMTYYQGGSVLFSIVVATLIVVLVRHRPGGGSFLGNPVIRWIGAISYGLYLWHWPVIVWLTPASTPFDGLALEIVRIIVMFAAASASYYLIERPIRRGGWGSLRISPAAWWWSVAVSMVAVSALLVSSTSSAVADADEASPDSRVTAADHLIGSTSPDAQTLLVVGDSIPKELMPALNDAAVDRDVSIIPAAFGGCSVIGEFQVDMTGSGFNWSKRCTDAPAVQDQALVGHTPDTVVWFSNRERYGIRTQDGDIILAGTPQHRETIRTEIASSARRLTAAGAELIIVLPSPKAEAAIGPCASEPDAPGCALDPTQIESFAWLRSVYTDIADELPRTRLVRADDVLCPSGAPCPAIEHEGIPIRPDGVHIAQELEPWFAEILLDRVLAQSAVRP